MAGCLPCSLNSLLETCAVPCCLVPDFPIGRELESRLVSQRETKRIISVCGNILAELGHLGILTGNRGSTALGGEFQGSHGEKWAV